MRILLASEFQTGLSKSEILFFDVVFKKKMQDFCNYFWRFLTFCLSSEAILSTPYDVPYPHAGPSTCRMRILRAPETANFGYLIFGFLGKKSKIQNFQFDFGCTVQTEM